MQNKTVNIFSLSFNKKYIYIKIIEILFEYNINFLYILYSYFIYRFLCTLRY